MRPGDLRIPLIALGAGMLLVISIWLIDPDGRPRALDTEVPAWVMRGIAMHESSSHYNGSQLVYVNRKRSKSGARGPFQVMPATFELYSFPGEKIEWLETDMVFAEEFAKRMLMQLYSDERSWSRALSVYNTGRVCSRGNIYAEEVAKKGKR